MIFPKTTFENRLNNVQSADHLKSTTSETRKFCLEIFFNFFWQTQITTSGQLKKMDSSIFRPNNRSQKWINQFLKPALSFLSSFQYPYRAYSYLKGSLVWSVNLFWRVFSGINLHFEGGRFCWEPSSMEPFSLSEHPLIRLKMTQNS